MPLKYVPPEEAFEVRIQCTEKQIQRHCDAAPENDRRDFDDQGGLQVPVYHVYKNGNIDDRQTYWYTFDETEDSYNEFDIRDLPNKSEHPYGTSFDVLLQDALDRGLVRINNNQLTTGGE
jgi:hypothetical protein|tara:strand:+ start:160 stop:519 length:360 start_codon:yes stop_codon:yes gene_type:complete